MGGFEKTGGFDESRVESVIGDGEPLSQLVIAEFVFPSADVKAFCCGKEGAEICMDLLLAELGCVLLLPAVVGLEYFVIPIGSQTLISIMFPTSNLAEFEEFDPATDANCVCNSLLYAICSDAACL